MAIVSAFLLGMPLAAVPQISAHLRALLLVKPDERAASREQPVAEAADEGNSTEHGTMVTLLASDRLQTPLVPSNPDSLAATIESLKAQFVEAGVSYMVLERIGTESAKYRFRLDLPVAEGSVYRKRFQVVDDAPDEAMRRAWTELQQWRVAGREPTHRERPTVILR
ncbi:MAG: hypothetical protein O3C40_03980 [Planctomycetota bacterium]|nr:hypothetical protein [Planctomycetota bacterium]